MMKNFIAEVKKLPEKIDSFEKDAWYTLVDYVTVYSKTDIRFTFKNGTEVKVQ